MEEQVIATKNNFSLISKVLTVALLIIYVLIPSSNELNKILNYIALGVALIVLILIIIHLLRPNNLITKKDDKLYLNRIMKIIAIDVDAIASIDAKYNSSRGYKYKFGTLIIFTKTNHRFKIYNVNDINNVYHTLSLLKK